MDAAGQLAGISDALKALHRALILSETGDDPNLEGPYSKLFALANDPRFAWMGVLSRLIVEIDETLDADEPQEAGTAEALIRRAGALISEQAAEPQIDEFRLKRMMALQREPQVGLATGRLRAALAAASAG